MRWFLRNHGVIGVDIGSRAIKAVQLSRSSQNRQITAITLLARKTPETLIGPDEVQDLKQRLQQNGFSGSQMALTAPEQIVLRGTLELPPNVAPDRVPSMARMELARIHRIHPDSFETVCWNAPRPEGAKSSGQTFALACPHEAAEAYLDTLEAGGLQVAGLDLFGHVTARVCAPLTLPAPTLTAVLDLGRSATKLVLLCGSHVIYECVLDVTSLQTLIDQLGRQCDIPPESAWDVIHTIGCAADGSKMDFDPSSIDVIRDSIELHFGQLAKALTAPFAYADHQYPGQGIRRLLLMGGGADVPGLTSYLASLLRVEVLLATPHTLYPTLNEPKPHVDHPSMTVALGLAMFSGE